MYIITCRYGRSLDLLNCVCVCVCVCVLLHDTGRPDSQRIAQMFLTCTCTACPCVYTVYMYINYRCMNVFRRCSHAIMFKTLVLFQAGLAGEDAPSAVFPTLVGRPRHRVSEAYN